MKILIDATTTQDQFANRGVGRYTHEVLTRMIDLSARLGKDDTFHLLTFNSPTTFEETITKYRDRINTVNIGKIRPSDKLNRLWWHRQYLPAIKNIIRDESPDIYFCPYFWRGFPYKLLPTIVMIHDLALPILGRYSTAPKYLDWIRKLQYHSSLKKVSKAAAVITNSQHTAKDLLRYVKIPEDKVHAIHLGISESRQKIDPDKDILLKYLPLRVIESGYILYYAGIEVNKNVPGIIKAYGELVKLWQRQKKSGQSHSARSKDMPYLVLAGGDFTKLDVRNSILFEIKALIDELALEDMVYFTGFFEDDHLNDLLNGARMFTHLSMYEGFGFAPLEAMKCGLPVVASNRSCYPDVLGDGAILVDPEDPEAVARVYFEVLNNAEYAGKVSKLAMEKANSYTWESTARKTYKLFEDVSKGNKADLMK